MKTMVREASEVLILRRPLSDLVCQELGVKTTGHNCRWSGNTAINPYSHTAIHPYSHTAIQLCIYKAIQTVPINAQSDTDQSHQVPRDYLFIFQLINEIYQSEEN